jgi:hypothetical protein
MKGRLGEPSRTLKGEIALTFITRDPAALRAWDELHDKDVFFEVKQYRERRSLDANAYFHVLVNKIAAKLAETDPDAPTDDEVKRKLVLDYGTLERDDSGGVVGAKLPAGVNVLKYYPYAKSYKSVTENGRDYECYIFYKRTRTLDTKEMTRLISGTVHEAKQLGIETMTPQELEAMNAAWEGRKA